jgi:lysine biosynthesis protein LysW
MKVAPCPDCGNKINLGSQPQEGQRLTCPNCEADLEVIGLNPLELDWFYNELDEFEGDWEYDDE